MPRNTKAPLLSTRLPIPNILSVGRQPPNKRQNYEAENIDNALVSLERNVEKRGGFSVVPQSTVAGLTSWDYTNNDTKLDLFNIPTEHDLWYYWFNINEDQRYLIIVDFNATGITDKLFYVYQINANNSWTERTSETQWDTGIALDNETLVAYADAHDLSVSEAAALGSVSIDSRSYITHGSLNDKLAKNSLKAVNLGSTIVILNKNVYAGFSSDVGGYKFDLDGNPTESIDYAGRRLVYYTAAKVTKIYSPGVDEVPGNSDDVFLGYRQDTEGTYIPVQDFLYYKRELASVGQRVNDASSITLPPQDDDWVNNNANLITDDTDAQEMLRLLYDTDHTHPTLVDGRGKVYFTLYPFLNLSSGYYRIQSFPENTTYEILAGVGEGETVTGKGRPYLQKIRTPDEWGYIDPARMPQRLSFTVQDEQLVWSIEPIKWTPRESGDKHSNPGPSIFRTIDGKQLKQVKLKALAVFKDRLFFAAEDLVFSSRLGNYEDLFINDATNITEIDPVDIRASSNTFAEISSLTPFEDYLFVDTKANMQFTLSSGSQVQNISPLNVSINPVTYYSTTAILEPQMVGSQLYFWDSSRLYLYLGEDKTGLAKAVELSLSVKDYLPVNFRCSTTAAAQDTLIAVDNDNPNHIYLYTIRFSGERLIQNSFYRFVLSDESSVQAVNAYGDYLYTVVHHGYKLFLERCLLKPESETIPKLDSLLEVKNIDSEGDTYSSKYDVISNQTIWKIPGELPYETGTTVLVLKSPYENQAEEDIAGVVLSPVFTQITNEPETHSYFTAVVPGNYQANDHYVYFGNPYTMTIELSTAFVRDENGNIVDGVLNLRNGVIRHHNTGNYRIEVVSRGRPALVTEFTSQAPDQDLLNLGNIQYQGETNFHIFGYSEVTNIKLVSDYLSPCNITAIELRGKFKQKTSIIDH